jgi:hypothetical protein
MRYDQNGPQENESLVDNNSRNIILSCSVSISDKFKLIIISKQYNIPPRIFKINPEGPVTYLNSLQRFPFSNYKSMFVDELDLIIVYY